MTHQQSITAIARRRALSAPDSLAGFAALTGNGSQPHTILLESAEPSSRKTQRSMLFVSSALSVVCRGSQVVLTALNAEGRALLPGLRARFTRFNKAAPTNDDQLVLQVPLPRDQHRCSEQERLKSESSLTILRELKAVLNAALPEAPEALYLTGVFAYDLVDQFEKLPEPQPGNEFPDYQFYVADRMLIIDHLSGQAVAIACGFGATTGVELERDLDRIEATLKTMPVLRDPDLAGAQQRRHAATTDCSDVQFADNVVQLKQHIFAGDVFQIVYSRSFAQPCRDAFRAYQALRSLNPSPYLFYMNGGNFVLFGASPESAVKVDGSERTIEISPIAGTRKRGLLADGSIDHDLDGRIEADLRLDEKESAEHMMLVDLARNDVARVAQSGSRYVANLLRTERYSHVMHLVSRVVGKLRDGLDALHAYQVSMNMGTLTGAPKIRAMQLLREHEGQRRGHYGGAIGYLRGDGSFDTAIVIRAALVQNGIAGIRAGAGIVHDSQPLAEAEETYRKAEAVLRAIAIAEAGISAANKETINV